MSEKAKETLKLQFNKRLRLEFYSARIASDAGLLACRELDGVMIGGDVTELSARDPRWSGENEKDRGRIASFQVESFASTDGRGFWGLQHTARMSRIATRLQYGDL